MQRLSTKDTDPAACRICGNTEDNRSFEAREMMFGTREVFVYSACAVCGCLSIQAVPADLGRHYGPGYYSFTESAFRAWVRHHAFAYRMAHVVMLGHLPRIPNWWPIDQNSKDTRVLDVGSGAGHLLLHLRCLGFRKLLGIDPFIAHDIRTRTGPTILKRTLPQVSGQYDVVVMNHSFEHMPDPHEPMGHLRQILSETGVAIIRTPVASSFAWREYGAHWVQLDPPRHLFVPTVASMRILAAAHGLMLDSVVHDSTEFQFWGSEQYRQGIPLHDRRSYNRSRRRSVFSRAQISRFKELARRLNSRGEGDQACFYLRLGR